MAEGKVKLPGHRKGPKCSVHILHVREDSGMVKPNCFLTVCTGTSVAFLWELNNENRSALLVVAIHSCPSWGA